MAENNTTCSTINRTADSSCPDQDVIWGKIKLAMEWIKMIKAHIIYLKARIAEAKESRKSSQYNIGDVTEMNDTFYNRVLGLWSSINNYEIMVKNETNKLYSVLASEIMNDPPASLEIVNFRRQMKELGEQVTPLQILLKEMAEDKENLQIKLMEKQKELVDLIAAVGDKMEQADSQTHPKEIQRRNLRLLKIKIVRCVINSLLLRGRVDFEENPDLLDIKIKWRHPVTLKSYTN